MAEYEHITFALDGPVAIVTLARPEVLNAFSSTMGRELQHAYERCDTTEAIRAVVVTGAGRAFCSGADFSNGPGVFGAPSNADTFNANPLRHFPAWRVRKPVIAAINGAAVGMGLTLALHCDLRIVASDAKLGIVQNRRGVMPDLDSHWMLPRIVGFARAQQILLTGAMFSGADAAQWGLANEAHAADAVLGRALELAHDVAVNVAPVSAAVSKRLLWANPPLDRDDVNRLETELHLHLMGKADAREGVMAFLERRAPQWQLTLRDDWPATLDAECGATRDDAR